MSTRHIFGCHKTTFESEDRLELIIGSEKSDHGVRILDQTFKGLGVPKKRVSKKGPKRGQKFL